MAGGQERIRAFDRSARRRFGRAGQGPAGGIGAHATESSEPRRQADAELNRLDRMENIPKLPGGRECCGCLAIRVSVVYIVVAAVKQVQYFGGNTPHLI